MITNRKVAVVGGAGYVGSAITKMLLDQGDDVIIIDNLSTPGYAQRLEAIHAKQHHLSLAQTDELTNVLAKFQPDVVFHMAALHYIPQAIKEPAKVIDTNITGTLNLIDALNQLAQPPLLVFTSSAAVYGAVTPAPQSILAPMQPCDIYGYSKMLGEHLVKSRYENHIIARLFNVIGESDPIPHLVPSIIRQLDQEVINLGNATSERDFIHVNDAARAFVAISRRGTRQGTYNIGSGTSYTVEEVAETIRQLSGTAAKFVFDVTERRAVDPPALCADIANITRDTGWRPTVSLVDSLLTCEALRVASAA